MTAELSQTHFDKKSNENTSKTIIDDYVGIGVMLLYYVSIQII